MIADLSALIGELSTRSEVFRTRWAAPDVRSHRTGVKRLRLPVVGYLELNFEAMEFPSDPGLTMLVYTAATGTPAAAGWRCWQAGQPPSSRATAN